MEPEISTKMLRNLSEKLRTKLPAATRGYSMVKLPRLDDAFSEYSELEPSRVKGQSLHKKITKGEKAGKAQKNINKTKA